MRLEFARSDQSTLGLEWELALVDRDSGQLRAVAEELLQQMPAARTVAEFPGAHATGEYLLNTVELVTGVCRTVQQGLDQLALTGADVLRLGEQLGVELYSQGSHPFAVPHLEPVSQDARYNKMLDRTQWWGRQMVIYGVHVHVGLPESSYAMPVVNHLINHFAHLLTLSASSPYWEGQDTGYDSQRTLVFQQLPTSGLPFQFHTWEEYERCVADFVHTGVVDDVSECRWDVRPVPRFGTVEMRICDGVATLREIGAIAALTQCLVEEACRQVAREGVESIEIMPPWYAQENKWRAARYGLEAIIILNAAGDEMLVTDHLRQVIQRLEPIAAELGCTTELGWVEEFISSRGPAARQRHIAREQAQPGGEMDLPAVVLDAAQRTRASIQDW